MEYTLMNGDREILKFDLDDCYMQVLDNNFLPYELKDYVQTTDTKNIKKCLSDIDTLKDFLTSRTLNLSRENAKVILNVANLPQSIKTAEKLKIVFACKGLSMEDNFWIKKPKENVKFKDVCLRTVPLSENSYVISILGKHVTATATELRPDLSSSGMFPKYWSRELPQNISSNSFWKEGSVYMWKTDKTTNQINTSYEIKASNILTKAGANVVWYKGYAKDGALFSVSECIANDTYSLVKAQSIMDYFTHTKRSFVNFIKTEHLNSFANMCVSDYILANTDRHNENWGFLINNDNNGIEKFAPLYDLNQTLIADDFETDINDLLYSPTNKTMLQTAVEMLPFSNLEFDLEHLPTKCLERLKKVTELSKEQSKEDIVKNEV